MAILYTSNFEAETPEATPVGWAAGIFVVRDWPVAAVSGTKAMAAWGADQGVGNRFSGIAARTRAQYQIKQRAMFAGASLLLQGIVHGDLVNNTTINNCYEFTFVASATSVTPRLRRQISTWWDAEYTSKAARTWSVVAGDVIVTKVTIDGVNLSVKVWNETNEAEPATATFTYTDTTQRPAGFLNVAYNNGGGLVATGFDDVTIWDLEPDDSVRPTLTGAVTFSNVTNSGYTASWPAGADNIAVARYEYQIGGSGGAWTSAGTNLSVNITGRAAGATEQFYVRAVDAAGNVSTPEISGSVTLAANTAGVISIAEPLKNNTGMVLANLSGIKAMVVRASDMTLAASFQSLTTNASGLLSSMSSFELTSGVSYHVLLKTTEGGVGVTGPISAT